MNEDKIREEQKLVENLFDKFPPLDLIHEFVSLS